MSNSFPKPYPQITLTYPVFRKKQTALSAVTFPRVQFFDAIAFDPQTFPVSHVSGPRCIEKQSRSYRYFLNLREIRRLRVCPGEGGKASPESIRKTIGIWNTGYRVSGSIRRISRQWFSIAMNKSAIELSGSRGPIESFRYSRSIRWPRRRSRGTPRVSGNSRWWG